MTCMCVDVFDDTGEIRPGGEALNFAAIASKYNHISVDLLGAIGDDDYGKAILKSIENKPISKDFIHIISGSATANHRIYLTEKVIDISRMIHGTVVFMTHISLAILTRTELQVLILSL